ncbi:MAG: ABC transporter ATP-binding protein [Caldilineaceae bacterium]|nr:ABC transporter ATP-binding protein [Caldilineaceae bacterium]
MNMANDDIPPLMLDVRNLTVDYVAPDKPPAHALQQVSFGLQRGEMLGIVGESGCGKSTLMLSLMRLLPAAGRIVDGEVNFLGQDLLSLSEQAMADVRWKHISMIFQGAMNALNPVRTVGSQIAEPITRHTLPRNGASQHQQHGNGHTNGHLGTSHGYRNGHHLGPPNKHDMGKAMKQLHPAKTIANQVAEIITAHDQITDKAILRRTVDELLNLVGINPNRRDQYPHQYSGGMRQRAMIAMALACSPEIVIADEPTTALDVMVQAQILELLARLREQLQLSVLFVTHDLGVVAEICDRVLVMYGGVVAEYSDVDTIFNAPRHPYTQELLKAFPDLTRPAQRLVSIPGYPPRLDALPPGCRFAPRCPLAFARCTTNQPPLYTLTTGHQASCYLVEPEMSNPHA